MSPDPGPAPSRGAGERIHLVSMAGYPNYGDELIAAAWLRYLASARPDAEIRLDTRCPGNADALFHGLHPGLRVTDAVFRTVEESTRSGRSPGALVREFGSPLFDLELLDLREATTLHLLGGGFITANWPQNDAILDVMRAAAEVSGARLIATGQGVAPPGAGTFSGFDSVSVRDRPSAEHLGVELGVDDAFLLPPAHRQACHAPGHEEYVVCVQSDAQGESDFERNVDTVRSLLDGAEAERNRVRYVEAIPGADYAGYAALASHIAPDGFIPFSAYWRDGGRPCPHQVWISTRFHHHLRGALEGARGVALAGSSEYYTQKHRSLAELGTRWRIDHGAGLEAATLRTLEAPVGMDGALRAKRAEADALYPRR